MLCRRIRNLRRIHTYSKRRRKELFDDRTREGDAPRPPLISKVATQEEFYESRGQGNALEKRLGKLENATKPVIDDILRAKSIAVLSPKRRTKFAKYLAAQYFRTLRYRRFSELDNKLMAETIYTDPTSEGSKILFDQFEREQNERLQFHHAVLDGKRKAALSQPPGERDSVLAEIEAEAQKLTEIKTILEKSLERMKSLTQEVEVRGELREFFGDSRRSQSFYIQHLSGALEGIIERSKWVVGMNTSSIPFITSDNPLAIYPLERLEDRNRELDREFFLCELRLVDFIELPGKYPPYELHLPLSPGLILLIRPFDKSKVSGPVPIDGEGVWDINHYQALQAHDQVFSETDTDLEIQVDQAELAEYRCRRYADVWTDD